MSLLWRIGLSAVIALSPLASAAEEIPEIYITPSKLDPYNSATRVISRNEIEELAATSVVEVLQSLPGIHIEQSGGIASVFLRGGDPNFTIVRINGVQVNDPSNSRGGSFDFSSLELSEIERIEVTAGSLSALLGSDALSGVIDIYTRSASDGPRIRAAQSLGRFSYSESSAAARVTHQFGASSLSLNVREAAVGTPGSSLDSWALSSSNSFAAAQLDIAVRSSSFLDFPSDSGGSRFAEVERREERESEELTTSLRVRDLGSIGNSSGGTLLLGLYARNEEVDSPAIPSGARVGLPAIVSSSRFRRIQGEYSIAFESFVLGVSSKWESGRSQGHLALFGAEIDSSFSETRYSLSPFVEKRFDLFESLELDLGLRGEIVEVFADWLLPLATLRTKRLWSLVEFSLHLGEGYKLPSFYALGNPLVGNPGLRAERSRQVEFRTRVLEPISDLDLEFSAFRTRYENLVDFDDGPPPMLLNRSRVVIKGVEVSLSYSAFKKTLFLSSGISYLDGNRDGTGQPLRNRPEWKAVSQVRYRFVDKGFVSAVVSYLDSRFDSSVPTGPQELESYITTDLLLSFEPAKRWVLDFGVANVFGEPYQDAIGVVSRGQLPYLKLAYRH